LSDWAEHLLWYKDGRFANHSYFKFIAHNMIIRKQTLEKSLFIVQQTLGEPHISISELKEKIEKGDESICKKILYFRPHFFILCLTRFFLKIAYGRSKKSVK